MNFVKGSLFTVISKAIMFLSSLFISIYIARILGPEAKGMYYILVQLVSIVILFGMFGIDNSAVYFLGRQRMHQAELCGHLFILTILCGFISFIFILASRNFLSALVLKGVPSQYIYIMAFAIPFLMFTQISLSIILGLNKIVMVNIFQMICYFLLFLNFAIFALLFKMGIYGACLGFAFTYLIMDCIYAALLSRNIKLQIRWETTKNILHYGLRSFLGPIFLLLIFRTDSFLLNIFGNIRQVGFYSIAVSVAELIPFIPIAIATVLSPKLASQETGILNASAAKVIRVMFLFLILLGMVFFIFGRWIILFLYGNMYNSSIFPMYILIPGFIFISLYYPFFSYFNAVGKPEILTAILSIILVIKLILSIIAIPRWGMAGAAGASTISYFLCGLLFLIAFWIKSKESLRNTFIIKSTDIKYVWNIFASLGNKYRVLEEILP